MYIKVPTGVFCMHFFCIRTYMMVRWARKHTRIHNTYVRGSHDVSSYTFLSDASTYIEFDVFQCTVKDLVQSLTVDSRTVSKHMSRTSVRHDVILVHETPRIVAADRRRVMAAAGGEKNRRQPGSPGNPNRLSNSTMARVGVCGELCPSAGERERENNSAQDPGRGMNVTRDKGTTVSRRSVGGSEKIETAAVLLLCRCQQRVVGAAMTVIRRAAVAAT